MLEQGSPLRRIVVTTAATLLGMALVFMLALMLPLYGAVGGVLLIALALRVGWGRARLETRRKVSENIFQILSGAAAALIVAFVLYLLVHIFLLGREQLSWSFLVSDPSEGLAEGGIFPAIVGTALLVIIMSVVGVPVGTVTAIYLTEYASARSVLARVIRFAVNTLAGVPAIVFGLFGLGFFIGTVGASMDAFEFSRTMTRLETVLAAEGSPFADAAGADADALRSWLEKDDAAAWREHIDLTRVLAEIHGAEAIRTADVMEFYRQRQRPHYGQPALIWAALTMALLTLPVVIVSVEEAIRTVPRDLREASLALGATKWTTIRRVVLPGAFTGILTGGILAVSRGAGEVAPILFTGAAYYLPELPSSLSSQFMELGYHIYVLTTQSTNVEATKPLLYATTFVLLILTFALNFSAIFLRSRVRRRLAKIGS